jgi:hypothetical protein
MQGSKVTVEFDGKQVFTFTEASVVLDPSEFPGNHADPQYAAKEAALDQSKYGCAYTGRHDHGPLPPQRRSSPHEATLRFLEQARKAVGDELNVQSKAAKATTEDK